MTGNLNLNNNNNNNSSATKNCAQEVTSRNYKIVVKPASGSNATAILASHNTDTCRLNTANLLQRAPGTSTCPHTARIDLRRVRSYRDLTQRQLIFSPHDFVFEEKLGEGFFANVKKIISKRSGQEMVLKELKLSCVPPPPPTSTPPPPLPPPGDQQQQQIADIMDSVPKLDLLLNYAELNAAHKSFLKEAQVRFILSIFSSG